MISLSEKPARSAHRLNYYNAALSKDVFVPPTPMAPNSAANNPSYVRSRIFSPIRDSKKQVAASNGNSRATGSLSTLSISASYVAPVNRSCTMTPTSLTRGRFANSDRLLAPLLSSEQAHQRVIKAVHRPAHTAKSPADAIYLARHQQAFTQPTAFSLFQRPIPTMRRGRCWHMGLGSTVKCRYCL